MQLSFGDDIFPDLDGGETKKALMGVFEHYHLCKYMEFVEREATLTASYEDRPSGPTNVTSDQTSNIAIYNVDEKARRKAFCERVERAVRHLAPKERLLIEERYLKPYDKNGEPIKDYQVYNFVFNPAIGKDQYTKIRKTALYKLALNLRIDVEKSNSPKLNE
ncbi:hypothetical protein PAECIP111891_04213 [Paenibacillus allorhizoplanae]|uniref:Transcriptional regulator n=1 Tax=Paenibacillus allorhizoplanae TaxID=2905648 RepID=A0ABM9CKC1_9BACL|nr:ArpU family phage packaging/lysis transcriptional regulator [Paenibacillus allorhizoplanae]CAH1215135.1 hypothetical protein PAECIP111891_04213 [Paenibacillus allorhizoplanae]